MPKSIKIDETTYNIVVELAKQENRSFSNTLAKLVKLGSDSISANGQQAPSVSSATLAPTTTLMMPLKEYEAFQKWMTGGQQWNGTPAVTLDLEAEKKKYAEAIKKAKEREANKKLSLDDLTEEDLKTAKVTFEDRPDFKEPDEWDKHAWPTV